MLQLCTSIEDLTRPSISSWLARYLYQHRCMNPQYSVRASCHKMLLSNMDSSPLLRLPREIKDQIYDYVFTSNAVHVHDFFGETSDIERKSNGQLYHHSCRWKSQQLIEYEENAAGELSTYHTHFINHGSCCYCAPCKRHLVPSAVRYLDLLLTCRQLSHEATKTLYANTIFCFDSWAVISKFMSRTPSSSLLNIRSIRIKVQTGSTFHYVLWTRTLDELSNTMRALSHLDLEIYHDVPRWQRGRSSPLPLNDENGLMKGLMSLSKLPLREVTVFISDPPLTSDPLHPRWLGGWEEGINMFGLLHVPWKLQFSRDLRKRLLNQGH